MADAKFTDRAALEAWAAQQVRYREPGKLSLVTTLSQIRRVTLTHAHLLATPPRHPGAPEGTKP